jgi:hypothetical protein
MLYSFYDARKSYRIGDTTGHTSKQTVAMMLSLEAYKQSLGVSNNQQLSLPVNLPQSLLRKLLLEHPEYFADCPYEDADTMSEQGRKVTAAFNDELLNPDSFAATFAAWYDEQPLEKE